MNRIKRITSRKDWLTSFPTSPTSNMGWERESGNPIPTFYNMAFPNWGIYMEGEYLPDTLAECASQGIPAGIFFENDILIINCIYDFNQYMSSADNLRELNNLISQVDTLVNSEITTSTCWEIINKLNKRCYAVYVNWNGQEFKSNIGSQIRPRRVRPQNAIRSLAHSKYIRGVKIRTYQPQNRMRKFNRNKKDYGTPADYGWSVLETDSYNTIWVHPKYIGAQLIETAEGTPKYTLNLPRDKNTTFATNVFKENNMVGIMFDAEMYYLKNISRSKKTMLDLLDFDQLNQLDEILKKHTDPTEFACVREVAEAFSLGIGAAKDLISEVVNFKGEPNPFMDGEGELYGDEPEETIDGVITTQKAIASKPPKSILPYPLSKEIFEDEA